MLFHVLAHDEVHFPFERLTRFEGLEEVRRLTADPLALRTAYLAEVERFRKTLRRVCRQNRIDLVEVDTARTPSAWCCRRTWPSARPGGGATR